MKLPQLFKATVDRLRPGRTITLDIDIPDEGDHLVILSDGIDEFDFEEYVYAVAIKKRFEELQRYEGTLRGPSGNLFHRTRGLYPSTHRQNVETEDIQKNQSPYERMQSLLTTRATPVAVHVSKKILHLNRNVANGTAPGSNPVNQKIAKEYIDGLNETIQAVPDENIVWMSEDEVERLHEQAVSHASE